MALSAKRGGSSARSFAASSPLPKTTLRSRPRLAGFSASSVSHSGLKTAVGGALCANAMKPVKPCSAASPRRSSAGVRMLTFRVAVGGAVRAVAVGGVDIRFSWFEELV